MDHKAHIGLVNTHTERVCGSNNVQTTFNETLLHVFLGFRRQSGMKMVRRKALIRKKLGYLFTLSARCAVHDYASWHTRRQGIFNNLVYVRELLRLTRRYDFERQVGAIGPSVKNSEINSQLFLEIKRDFIYDVGLGGRSKAKQRRYRLIPSPLADETSHITVIGPEIMPPL